MQHVDKNHENGALDRYIFIEIAITDEASLLDLTREKWDSLYNLAWHFNVSYWQDFITESFKFKTKNL